jgi:hypothetical protein
MNRRIFLVFALASALGAFACGPQSPQVRRVRPGVQVALGPEEALERSHYRYVRVAVQGKYAYVGIDRWLVVVDVADPRQPVVVGRARYRSQEYFWHEGVNSIAVSGKHAYVLFNVTSPGGLHKGDLVIFDVADPAAPAVVCSYQSTWGPREQRLSVAVSGKYAYLYSTFGLEVVDVSQPKTPKHVGSWRTAGTETGITWSGSHVAVAGDHVYVADRQAGLRIVDVSSPGAPKEVGSFKTGSYARAVAVVNQRALVLAGGLRIVDVSDPKQPREVGSLKTIPGGEAVADLAASERFACVYGAVRKASPNPAYGGVRVIDLSNPVAPKVVYPGPLVETLNDSFAVALQGNHAFIAGVPAPAVPGQPYSGGVELSIADLADPARPAITGSTDLLPPPVTDIAALGDHAYVANGRGGLRVVNVADRAAPREIASFLGPDPIKALAFSDQLLLASTDRGLLVLDVSNPAHPRQVTTYDTAGAAPALAMAGKFACVTMGDGSLEILDLSQPAAPQKLGAYRPFPTHDWWVDERLAASDDYVFVLHGSLRVVDVSYRRWLWIIPYLWPAGIIVSLGLGLIVYRCRRWVKGVLWLPVFVVVALPLALVPFVPKVPREVGHYNPSPTRVQPPPVTKVEKVGELNVAEAAKGKAPDASRINIPPDRVRALAVADGYAYLVGITTINLVPVPGGVIPQEVSFLRVLDVADPANLREAGTVQLPHLGIPMHVSVVGKHAYVTGGPVPGQEGARMSVVDVSDPAAPKLVGSYGRDRGFGRALAVHGQHAFIAEGRGGLRIVDISNPAAPRPVGSYEPRPIVAGQGK